MTGQQTTTGRAYSKAARRKRKKAMRENQLGLPDLAATAGREPNGRAQRDAQNEGRA